MAAAAALQRTGGRTGRARQVMSAAFWFLAALRRRPCQALVWMALPVSHAATESV